MSAGSQDYTVGAGRKPKEGLVLFEGVYVSVVPKDDYDALAARLAEYETLLAKAGEAFTEGSVCIAATLSNR